MEDLEELELSNVRMVLEEYCEAFKQVYKENLEHDGRRASGQLIDNLETEIKVGGTTITVVLNVADYYRYVENGRPSGKFPPMDKILKWIKDKPIIPRADNKGRLPSENQLAFLIGRKISREGYEGKPSLMNTVEQVNDIYIERLKAALQEDFGVYSLKILGRINKMLKM